MTNIDIDRAFSDGVVYTIYGHENVLQHFLNPKYFKVCNRKCAISYVSVIDENYYVDFTLTTEGNLLNDLAHLPKDAELFEVKLTEAGKEFYKLMVLL